jgi:hypothetical protein
MVEIAVVMNKWLVPNIRWFRTNPEEKHMEVIRA